MSMAQVEGTSDALFWSVLPPIPIRGVGTPLVESAEHYMARLAWSAGTTISQIYRLQSPYEDAQFKPDGGTTSFNGPGKWFMRCVHNLERLTGVGDIRCGTFYVLGDVLAMIGVNRQSRKQRWCPQCYLEWSEDSWEPLAWAVELQTTCPSHLCNLEFRCRSCGSSQRVGRSYQERRRCHSCSQSLGAHGVSVSRPKQIIWAERQIAQAVEMCADPGQKPIPYKSYALFVTELTRRYDVGNSSTPATVRAAIGRVRAKSLQGRVTFRTLIDLSALQSVSISEMLLSPREAAGRPLLDLSVGHKGLDMPNGSHVAKISAFRQCVADMLDRHEEFYLPSMQLLMKRFRLNRDLVRELSVDAYEDYQLAFSQQLPYSQWVHMERAFRLALSELDDLKLGSNDSCAIAMRVAAASNCSSAQAGLAVRSAIRANDALARAQNELLSNLDRAL